ncbi:MAG: DUF4037 domain-containing protein [Calditrichaeota bacterium]|nr:MAG: DUF4037 domain-containing protein [Calditrichota bacterium]
MKKTQTPHRDLARTLAGYFSELDQIQAVALGGSHSTGAIDADSDIDLYVFIDKHIPLQERKKIVNKRGASRANLNLSFWDLGDEWFDAETGIEVDMMLWQRTWIEEQIDRVVVRNEASVGYSTCFWHTILHAQILFDRTGWFAALQTKCKRPFPDKLRNAIIAKNHPVLRQVIPAYSVQIHKAIKRNDLVSINHRVAGLLASYFEVIYAINCVLNPGEKKIIPFITKHCAKIPVNMAIQVERVLQMAAKCDTHLLDEIDILIDGLDDLLRLEGINPENTLILA